MVQLLLREAERRLGVCLRPYSEGVFGRARALRTAELNDGAVRDFIVAFYKTWLSQARGDPGLMGSIGQNRTGLQLNG